VFPSRCAWFLLLLLTPLAVMLSRATRSVSNRWNGCDRPEGPARAAGAGQ